MVASESKDILDEIVNLIKTMKVKEKEFKPLGIGKRAPIHDRILMAIKKKLESRYTEKLTEYGIDYVKREARDPKYGRIELEVEVDRLPWSYRSWKKLIDIRSDNNVWILVPDEKRVEDFEWAVDQIREIISSRGEDETTIGRFIAILKRPDKFKVEEIIKRKPKEAT